MVSKEDLNAAEKRRVLEAFVENDDALGLLLDFISNKHLKKPGEPLGTGAAVSGHSTATEVASNQGIMAQTMRSGMALPNTGSQLNNFHSTGHSGSLIHNMIGGGADGASQTIYSTQYQLYLQNLQNNKSKLSEGLQM